MRFSEHFDLNRSQPYLDFVDIPLDTDLPVFLEPGAIKALNSPWGVELASLLQSFFETVLQLIKEGEGYKAQHLLASLSEGNEFHLGYSSGKSRGHGFGSGSAQNVWVELSKSNAVVTGLLQDLEDTALLIPGVGSDMISDAVSNILRGPLIKYTQDMCRYYGIPLSPGVASGAIWNPAAGVWEVGFTELPMTPFGKVILVPKLLVRHALSYDYDEYYRHHMLPVMQQEHLSSQSSLVQVLKDGSLKAPTKKSLMEKYGADKLAVTNQTLIRPEVLQEYKAQKARTPSRPLSQEFFADIEHIELPDLDPLVEELKTLSTGRETAGRYEDLIEKILSVLFYPSLCNPKREHNIHEGRKRIDITYTNEAREGFFYWLAMHYPCPMIFVECKNYGKEVSNPEIDQLSGRFSPSRGVVGILICRSMDKKKLYQRCADTSKDQRGYILALDDEDILKMAEDYKQNPHDQECRYLRHLWSYLIN